MPGNKRNYTELTAREAKISQLNNYQTESAELSAEADSSVRPINLSAEHSHGHSNPRNINTESQNCKDCTGVRHKDNKGNVSKPEVSAAEDCLEECVYSEVTALISANEWRPQFLLQLFKDLRLLSSCSEPSMQAVLTSIHSLASRTAQGGSASEEGNNQLGLEGENCQQPRNWSHKEPAPQLPSNCAKLDWEVRSILVEMLPFIKCQLDEVCGPGLLEAVRHHILRLVPQQSTQEQLDAQLEDALHKFHGCRLGEVYEELLTVVADVLISELTFLRLVNTVHHTNTEQQNGENVVVEEDEEEGAVGGVVGVVVDKTPAAAAPASAPHPANQQRRTKSETVSEADLAEADQSRHNNSEEESDTPHLLEEEAAGSVASGGNTSEDCKTEANWAVEQDRELGLDQVPTRLHNPQPETEQEPHPHPGPGPGPSDPGVI